MPDWVQAIVLGILQGATEFLPVSSSGHLVLLQAWLGEDFLFKSNALAFDLVLHLGTLVPIFWFYRVDLRRTLASVLQTPRFSAAGGFYGWLTKDPDRQRLLWVMLATSFLIPVALGLKDQIELLFHSRQGVAVAFLLTGTLLFTTRFKSPGVRSLGLLAVLLAGAVQCVAIAPGISRSGSTIGVLLLLGVAREDAARFSFFLAIPAILGGAVLLLSKGIALDSHALLAMSVGFLSAMVSGYFALIFLVRIVRGGQLHWFAYYLWPLGLTTLWWTY